MALAVRPRTQQVGRGNDQLNPYPSSNSYANKLLFKSTLKWHIKKGSRLKMALKNSHSQKQANAETPLTAASFPELKALIRTRSKNTARITGDNLKRAAPTGAPTRPYIRNILLKAVSLRVIWYLTTCLRCSSIISTSN